MFSSTLKTVMASVDPLAPAPLSDAEKSTDPAPAAH